MSGNNHSFHNHNVSIVHLVFIVSVMSFFYLSGCSKMVLLDNEGARTMTDKKVTRLVRLSQLTGVIVKAGADGAQPLPTDTVIDMDFDTPSFKVSFDSTSGIVDINNMLVYATDINGNERTFKKDDLIWMRYKRQGIGPQFIEADFAFYSLEKGSNQKFDDINFLNEACWELIVFDKAGGLVNNTTSTVDGLTISGMIISASLDNIRYLSFDLGRPSLTKTISKTLNKNRWKIIKTSLVFAVGYWFVQGWSDVMGN